MSVKSNTDVVLSILGYGRWQIPFLLLTFWIHLYVPINIIGSTVLSVPVPFRCFSLSSAPKEGAGNGSSTSTTSRPLGLTYYDSVCEPSNHTFLHPSLSAHVTTLPSCPAVAYDPSKFPNTVITEFDLVCERAVLRPVFQMSVSVGVPVGGLVGGVISDKYGRRTVVIAGSVVSAAGAVALAACPWYLGVLACRFLLGMAVSLIILPSYSLGQEVMPSHMRSQSGMLVGLGYSVGAVIMAGMAYLVRPWRYLLLVASSTLFIIIPWAYMVGESPMWLAQKGRQKEAADALERGARRNRVPMTPELAAALENLRIEKGKEEDADVNAEEGERASLSILGRCFGQCRHYLRYPGLRMILLVSPVTWYLQSLLYMGLMLNANNFTSNDPFLYVAMSGVIDGSAIILSTPIAMRVGRRRLLTILNSVAGVLLLLDIAIPKELKWLKWVVVMTAFLMASAGFQIQFIYTPELYPTVMRSRGFGLSNGAGSLGTVTAPIITDILAQQAWWSVNLVCGAAGLIGSLLLRFLPETRNLPLPETLQDVERRRKNYKEKGEIKVMEESNDLRSEEESPLEQN